MYRPPGFAWRADVARIEDACANEGARGERAAREQLGFGVAETRDPVRASRSGEMRVAINERRNGRGARAVDDLGVAAVGLTVARTDIGDLARADEQRDVAAQR